MKKYLFSIIILMSIVFWSLPAVSSAQTASTTEELRALRSELIALLQEIRNRLDKLGTSTVNYYYTTTKKSSDSSDSDDHDDDSDNSSSSGSSKKSSSSNSILTAILRALLANKLSNSSTSGTCGSSGTGSCGLSQKQGGITQAQNSITQATSNLGAGGVRDIAAGAKKWMAEVTAYHGGPYSSAAEARLEGGGLGEPKPGGGDGQPLKTLNCFLESKCLYVTIAVDKELRSKGFPYGKVIRIPYMEQNYNKGGCIPFAVEDNGGAFNGRGKNPPDKIDIAWDKDHATNFKKNLEAVDDNCGIENVYSSAQSK